MSPNVFKKKYFPKLNRKTMHRTSKTISCFTSHGVCTDVHQCLCSMFTNGILIENKCFIRQNEIEVIANGICIHQLLLSAKCFILNAATIIAATRLERLQTRQLCEKPCAVYMLLAKAASSCSNYSLASGDQSWLHAQ